MLMVKQLCGLRLPNEEELFDVVVNPHVAMMGNSDIPARMKVDYSTLKNLYLIQLKHLR